jgi:hypothetical protein
MDVTHLRLEDLEYDCNEPLKSWTVRYRDGEQVRAELQFDGLREAHLAHKAESAGHLDQPCKVVGYVELDGQRIAIDTLGMRDKSWGPRPDRRVGSPAPGGITGMAYTYGNRSGEDQFLVYSMMTGNVGQARPGGYLVRNGTTAPIARGERRVLRRSHGHPDEVEMNIEDDL